MVGLFVVAAGVTAVAIPPGLLGGRRRPAAYAGDASAAHAHAATGGPASAGADPDGLEPTEPGLAL